MWRGGVVRLGCALVGVGIWQGFAPKRGAEGKEGAGRVRVRMRVERVRVRMRVERATLGRVRLRVRARVESMFYLELVGTEEERVIGIATSVLNNCSTEGVVTMSY